MTILRNQTLGQGIVCVLVNNTASSACSSSLLQSVARQISSAFSCLPENLLFIVVTGNLDRDKGLASCGLNLWIADSGSEKLYVYEDQPSDFCGLREGIEQSIEGEFSDGMFEFGNIKGGPGMRSGARQAGPAARQAGHAARRSGVPFVTLALAALNIIYFVVLTAGGSTRDTSYMVQMGANFGPYIFQRFEIWRLFTAMFLHFGMSHLVGNMIYLGITGYNLEKAVGHLKFFVIYILSGAGGNLVSAAYYYLRGSYTVSAGASGAIYGLIGGIAALTFVNFRRMRPTYVFFRIIILLVFVFYSSFASTDIDGAAHIGGFFFGLLLTVTMVIGRKKKTS